VFLYPGEQVELNYSPLDGLVYTNNPEGIADVKPKFGVAYLG
jgi:hypothetical protein